MSPRTAGMTPTQRFVGRRLLVATVLVAAALLVSVYVEPDLPAPYGYMSGTRDRTAPDHPTAAKPHVLESAGRNPGTINED
jgi:hypothetical protein